jgi:hypothetical protein
MQYIYIYAISTHVFCKNKHGENKAQVNDHGDYTGRWKQGISEHTFLTQFSILNHIQNEMKSKRSHHSVFHSG